MAISPACWRPVDTFRWLLEHSMSFNRVVMNQLNERLAQFIAARAIDRMTNLGLRAARRLLRSSAPFCFPVSARCCVSSSRNWLTWWACPASV